MKLKIVLALCLVANVAIAQNLFTKTVSKLAKNLGKGVNVEASSNLNDITPTIIIESNLHSDKVGTISQTFFDAWVPGGDMAVVMFTGSKGPSFVKVDGTVTIDGKPVEYLTAGLYSQTTPANSSARNVTITTTSGQTSSFTISPFSEAPFKIKSINGSGENATLDLTKDVVIELENISVPENGLLKVSLAINQVSIKSFYEVAFVKAAPTITIPAAAFRNINIKPAGNAVFNYKKSYLQVTYESNEKATNVEGVYPSIQYVRGYSDGKFVTVSNEPDLNPGITLNGTENDFKFQAYKAHAFLSRPSSQMKKAGLLSLSIRGTTYQEVIQASSTSATTMNPFGGASTTTTVATITTTKELPWEGLLEEIYPELMNVINTELNAEIIAVEKITATPSYQIIQASAYNDPSTKVEFEKNFRSTKAISAFMPISEGYGNNSVYQKIMNEAGADALITLTLDLQLSQEGDGGDKMLMIPKLAFDIAGKANGRIANTKYFAGTIESATVSSFSKDITATELAALIRKSDMLATLAKVLKTLKEKEQQNADYEIVWNLQN